MLALQDYEMLGLLHMASSFIYPSIPLSLVSFCRVKQAAGYKTSVKFRKVPHNQVSPISIRHLLHHRS